MDEPTRPIFGDSHWPVASSLHGSASSRSISLSTGRGLASTKLNVKGLVVGDRALRCWRYLALGHHEAKRQKDDDHNRFHEELHESLYEYVDVSVVEDAAQVYGGSSDRIYESYEQEGQDGNAAKDELALAVERRVSLGECETRADCESQPEDQEYNDCSLGQRAALADF